MSSMSQGDSSEGVFYPQGMCCPETPPNTVSTDLEDSTVSLVPTVLEGPEVSIVSEVKTISKLSLRERKRQLQKFELLLLSDESVEEFNKLFVERQLDISEPPFQSWLILKNAFLPTNANNELYN